MSRATVTTRIGLLIPLIAATMLVASAADLRWVAAWTAAPDSAGPPMGPGTIRQIVRTSIRGSSVRIRLSNLFAVTPLTIGPVRVAKHAQGSEIQPGTDHQVTFGGKATATIPGGADALSDPVALPVAAFDQLAVSVYLPSRTGPSTTHGTGIQTAFIAAGDVTAATALPAGETDTSRYFVTGVDVAASDDARAIVIVGDSITDGVGSTPDTNARWPDALAARLQADPALASLAVVNAGISGNRILNDGADPFVGPSVQARFDRDALGQPGVRWILLLSGGNDISAARILATPKDNVSAQQIIDGMKTLIARAHLQGVKIAGATLTPKAGSKFFYAEGEAKRQVVNAWIRRAEGFDAVIDFDQALRDPARPDWLLPALDSGDHLHPNDHGYRAMAAAVDLRIFTRDK